MNSKYRIGAISLVNNPTVYYLSSFLENPKRQKNEESAIIITQKFLIELPQKLYFYEI